MSEAIHQTGLIITKLDDGSYACTMTSIMADLTPDHLHELFAFFEMHNPQSLEQINKEIARDGQAVVGTPTTLRPEEEALCIC